MSYVETGEHILRITTNIITHFFFCFFHFYKVIRFFGRLELIWQSLESLTTFPSLFRLKA